LDGSIHVESKMVHFLLAVKVSSNDVISFHKGIKFSLKILVLLGKEG
jgi:hypothetical protein